MESPHFIDPILFPLNIVSMVAIPIICTDKSCK